MASPAQLYCGFKIYSHSYRHASTTHFSLGSCDYAPPFSRLSFFVDSAFPMMNMRQYLIDQ